MNILPPGTFASIGRSAIIWALGLLVGFGLLSQDNVGPVADAAMTIIVVGWSVVAKYRAQARAIDLAHQAAKVTHVSGIESAREFIAEAKQENRV